ncbi:MAG: hypothetical protein AzoDbin1_02138 [Azoarcus sp.]|nr:hypothetical protein [Azoarcus sp.]
MLPSKAKSILATNLRTLSGGTDTQAFREKIAKKTGGDVSARTIGNMMSVNYPGNPTLANLEAVANALDVTVGELLTENLGRNTSANDARKVAAAAFAVSPRAHSIIERLSALERAHRSPPALYALIENALDLIQPAAGAGDYPGLEDLGN